MRTSWATINAQNLEVLGYFHLGSLHLQFNEWSGDPSICKSAEDAIACVPLSLLSHEFVHFVQTVTTGAGLRQFARAVDSLHLGAIVIALAAEAEDGCVSAPIFKHLHKHKTEASGLLRDATRLLRALRGNTIYQGGFRCPSSALQSEVPEQGSERGWLRIERTFEILGETTVSAVPFVDLLPITGESKAVALGAIHLEESCAKSVERVQRMLFKESGDAAHFGDQYKIATAAQRMIAEPYFVANWLFGNMTKATGCRGVAEEFFGLADAALLLDPFVLKWAGFECGAIGVTQGDDMSWEEDNPFWTYLTLLCALSEKWMDLPRIGPQWRQREMCEFQSALLSAAGVNCTLQDVTDAVIELCKAAFDSWEGGVLVSAELLQTYRETFVSMLKWRRDVLGGGAVLEDYHTSPHKLRQFVASTVPTIGIGTVLVSPRGGVRPGEGIGVDICDLLVLYDVMNAILYGDRACVLCRDGVRNCVCPKN